MSADESNPISASEPQLILAAACSELVLSQQHQSRDRQEVLLVDDDHVEKDRLHPGALSFGQCTRV